MIAVSRLLKSCAMPPARRPTASIFCEWRSCSSSSSRLVIASSRSAMIAASSRPLSEPSARNVNSRNCVNSIGNAENGPMPMPAIAIANAGDQRHDGGRAARAEAQARPADDREEDERDRHVRGSRRCPTGRTSAASRRTASSSSAMRFAGARPGPRRSRRPYAHAKTSGAVTITPSQSRSHHSRKS